MVPERVPAVSLEALLSERFGLQAFRDGQREAIEALLAPEGRVLLVAPTGGGKSLCYQLPALALPGTTLVVSPLISLMEDQVHALGARGVPATFIASNLPRDEVGRRLGALRRGELKIVYVAPERLGLDSFQSALEAADVGLVAVDEAHCIVQWGHDFRPDYMRIGEMLRHIGEARRARRGEALRVLACTATATPEARDDIVRQLGLEGATVVLRGFARPNLHLGVVEVSGPRDGMRETEAAMRRALGSPRDASGAAIVYCATRKGTERIATELSESGWKARAYHAGLDPESRASLSQDFAERRQHIVVATNAFGMGIDRPDVRLVVHAQPPASLEAYYQEVGRAGRDGAHADGLLLFAAQDVALRRRMCETSADGRPASKSDVARAWGLFRELLRYLDARTCRHDFILRYFGDEEESLGGCGHCDVCRDLQSTDSVDPALLARDADIVRRALAGVARTKGRAGLQAVASMLRGEASERVTSLLLDRLSTFGVLSGNKQEEVTAVLRVAIAAGWVDLTTTDYPVPVLTDLGWEAMRGERDIRVRLPGAPVRARKPRGGGRAAAPVPVAVHNASLFEALRVKRASLAATAAVPAYVVATDATLRDMAAKRPRSHAQLLGVSGMGPTRAERYGAPLLEVVAAHEA
ncbi:MAG: ATP-dependent DNA helicase RecQ [Polyangiaceae bacterium]